MEAGYSTVSRDVYGEPGKSASRNDVTGNLGLNGSVTKGSTNMAYRSMARLTAAARSRRSYVPGAFIPPREPMLA
ncbi:hypothetical protein VTK56DRAFT_6614 [Thermocarpiscus australiensis]